MRAAEAAHCAQEQGKFWEYHDLIFANQQGENQGAFNRELFMRLAKELSLDETAFAECYDSRKYEEYVRQVSAQARRIGVSGTPTILVNQQVIPGFVEFEELEKVILQELNKD